MCPMFIRTRNNLESVTKMLVSFLHACTLLLCEVTFVFGNIKQIYFSSNLQDSISS